MVAIVPQLSRDEDLRARDTRFFDGSTDGGLGAVDTSCVNVSIACFQGFGDGVFLGASILPGSEANGRCDCV